MGWPVSASHTRTVLSPTAGDDAPPVGAERHTGHRVRVAGQRLADGLAGGRVPQPHRVVLRTAAGDDAVPVGAKRHTRHGARVAGQRRAEGWPVSASHTRTVLSRLPETMRLPSGLNATLVTTLVWPVSGWPTGWPVCRVPHPHRVVGTAGDDALAVGAERHTVHRARCGRSAARRRLAGVGVPHPHRLVPTAGDDPLAVGAERHTGHHVRVAGERLADGLGRCRRPTPAPSCRRCRRRCAARRG